MLRLFPFLLLKLGHFPIYGLVHVLEFLENEPVRMYVALNFRCTQPPTVKPIVLHVFV